MTGESSPAMSAPPAAALDPGKPAVHPWPPARVALLHRTLLADATADEVAIFIDTCRRTGLDPFSRQIYPIRRAGVLATLVSIDGLRVIAERSGHYAGQLGPWWCGPDGQWRDAWLDADHPAAARIAVLRDDFREPLYAVARWASYAPVGRDGRLGGLWQKLGDVLLAKCAEALALRRALPADLSGLYVTEEMEQAETPAPGPVATEDVPRAARPRRAVAAMDPRPDAPPPTDGAAEIPAPQARRPKSPATRGPASLPDRCPKCGGPLWDNRADKRNPKSPDFKCQSRACGWAQWLDRDGGVGGGAASGGAAPVARAAGPGLEDLPAGLDEEVPDDLPF